LKQIRWDFRRINAKKDDYIYDEDSIEESARMFLKSIDDDLFLFNTPEGKNLNKNGFIFTKHEKEV
jgi:cell division protein FtsB